MQTIKALFAINQDSDWKVQKQFQEHIETKDIEFPFVTEYNFQGVKDRLQKEKFDIIILYEKLDGSREITARDIDLLVDVTNTRILFIMEEKDTLDKAKSIVAQGVYDILYTDDFDLSGAIELILRPRDKKGAKEYLAIEEVEAVEHETDIDYDTIQNINQNLGSLEDKEALKEAYEYIKNRYNDQQLKILFANIDEELINRLIEIDPFSKDYIPEKEEETEEVVEEAPKKRKSIFNIGIGKSKDKDKGKEKSKIKGKKNLTVPKPKHNKAAPQVVKGISIGVGGTFKNAGTTHTAISIATYLKEQNYKVAIVEFNQNPMLYQLKNQGAKDLGHCFNYRGIDFYTQIKPFDYEGLEKINYSDYHYVVLDLGAIKMLDEHKIIKRNDSYREFKRATKKIICLNGSAWNWQNIIFYRNDQETNVEPNTGEWELFINFASEKDFAVRRKEIKAITEFGEIYHHPIHADPFSLSDEKSEIYQNALQDLVMVSGKSKNESILMRLGLSR